MEAKYKATHAKEILKPCDVLENLILLNDSGVWPVIERDMLMQAETEMLRWRAARELQRELGAPDVNDTPMLPMPFTARELAAFMLDGAGALVADFYGNWDNGPDSQSLNHIDLDSGARMAVVDAFAAYRLARGLVGELDIELQNRAHALQQSYWDARRAALEREKVMEPNDTGLPEAEYLAECRRRLKLAVDPLADLDAEAGRVSEEAKKSYKSWLSAMVCTLLKHGQSASLVAEPATYAPKQTNTRLQPEAVETGAENLKPVQRSAAQDAAILAAIRKAGCDPLALPVNERGKPGVKAGIRAALGGTTQLFPKESTVFNKAWERLRQCGDIADKA